MPDVVVRPFEARDADGFWRVASIVYYNGEPIPPEKRDSPFFTGFVAELDGAIVGRFRLMKMHITRGTASIPCFGVAGVAVLPHVRGAGVGQAMMQYVIEYAREQEMPLASLYAFRESFYRKTGYEVCGKRIKITCPMSRMPRLPATLPVRMLTPTEYRTIEPCYQEFAQSRSGLNLRDEDQWQRVLAENKALTIYAAGDPVEAYVAVSHKTDFWSTDHLSEVIWSSRRGYQAILGVIHGLGINKTAFSWHEPSDSPFLAQYLDHSITTEIDRPIMFRVSDVAGALRLLKPNGTGSFSFRVVDNLDIAGGTWHVQYSPEEVVVEESDEADLTLDIRQFAQAFLGDPNLAQLRAMELVQVTNEAGFASATELLSPMAVACYDFF